MSEPLTDLPLERSYIAGLLMGSSDKHMSSADRLSPLDCAKVEHGRILAAVYDMHARGEVIDALTVDDELRAKNAPPRLREALSGAHMSAVRLEPPRHMADRLRALARARRVRELLMRATVEAESEHVDGALELAREVLGEERLSERSEILPAGEVCRIAMAAICDASATRPRLRSGLAMLDRAIKGFPPATLTVIGGDTGTGKSSAMLSIAMHMVQHQGARIGIVSVEDPPAVWGPRVLAHLVNIDSERLEEGKITQEMIDEAWRGIELAERLGLYFRFELSKPLHDVTAAMRALVVEKRCDAIMVDYAQAIALADGSRREAMIDALRKLKGEAQALNVPLLLASQLSRGENDFREPTKRSLKEAGELENMAEIIVLLWATSDREAAPVLGKVAKVKWSPKRPRFELLRDPRGSVCGLGEPPATTQKSTGVSFPSGGRHD